MKPNLIRKNVVRLKTVLIPLSWGQDGRRQRVGWRLFCGYDLANIVIEANGVEKRYKRYRSLARILEPNKRIIIVGDTRQFIVGFSPKPACQKMA